MRGKHAFLAKMPFWTTFQEIVSKKLAENNGVFTIKKVGKRVEKSELSISF
jgi:hypothetical protein